MTYEIGDRAFIDTSEYRKPSALTGVVTAIAKNGRVTVQLDHSPDKMRFTSRGRWITSSSRAARLVNSDQYFHIKLEHGRFQRTRAFGAQLRVVESLWPTSPEELVKQVEILLEKAKAIAGLDTPPKL